VRSHANVTAELRVTSDPGAGPATGYAQFNRAFRLVQDGALLLALHRAMLVGDDIDAMSAGHRRSA
jgi:hypothetical protein